MFGFVDGLALNGFAFLSVDPVFLHQLSVSLVVVVELLEVVVFEGLVLLPLFGDLSSTPEPHSLDIEVAWGSVDTVASEGILTEVIEVADEAVHEISCQVVDDSLT